ncbi:MAG: polymer-forming cytoskeletal protein [Bacteroidetes bacterium]|jgi:cytoskeletal protein CcmA (bactofilin family)|nr:polymer-forming cytoskeletal protein [Bacteroidota bacterium]
MAKYTETEATNNSINQVGNGTEITGDIKTNGDIRIDGVLEGNIFTKGKVVIGETGKIKGEVECKNSVVSGSIEGKISVSELLSLKASSKVNGDINTQKLAIEPGAKFTGTCAMNQNNPFANAQQQGESKEESKKLK